MNSNEKCHHNDTLKSQTLNRQNGGILSKVMTAFVVFGSKKNLGLTYTKGSLLKSVLYRVYSIGCLRFVTESNGAKFTHSSSEKKCTSSWLLSLLSLWEPYT